MEADIEVQLARAIVRAADKVGDGNRAALLSRVEAQVILETTEPEPDALVPENLEDYPGLDEPLPFGEPPEGDDDGPDEGW